MKRIGRFLILIVVSVSFGLSVAYAAPYCTDIGAMDQGEVSGGSSWFGAVGHNMRLESELLGKESTDIIVGRYIYDGYAWRTASVGTPESGDDLIYYVRSYSETKDLAIASGWVYTDATGQTKQVVCNNYLQIYNREPKNYGTKRLSYPAESLDQTITGSYPYIGLAWQVPGTVVWSGNNGGYLPSSQQRPSYPYTNDWYLFGPSIWIRGYTTNISGAWTSSDRLFGRVWYPNALPNQFTFTLTRPIFNTGEGAGAYSDFNFDNIIVYSRSTGRNTPPGPPPLPTPTCAPVCSPLCGQSDGCGGTCLNTDGVAPSETATIVYPAGTVGSPTAVGTSVAFQWNRVFSSLADYYALWVWNSSDTRVKNVDWIQGGLTTVSYTMNVSDLSGGQTYHWAVRAVNGIPCTTPSNGPWSTNGYFRLNAIPTFGSLVLKNAAGTVIGAEN